MKYTAILFCIAATGFVAKAASISGEANIDKSSAGAQGKIVFPRIPGINAPLSSLIPSLNNDRNGNRTGSTPSSSGSSPLSDISKLFDIPDPASLIPDLPSSGNGSDAQVPQIPGLPDLSNLPKIPGLSDAMQAAREHIQTALQLGSDIPSGIQQAIQEAFEGNDPVAAIRTIIKTILDAYLAVAANCPLMVVGSRVIQEGIRLALEAAKSARNVIFGN